MTPHADLSFGLGLLQGKGHLVSRDLRTLQQEAMSSLLHTSAISVHKTSCLKPFVYGVQFKPFVPGTAHVRCMRRVEFPYSANVQQEAVGRFILTLIVSSLKSILKSSVATVQQS